MARKAIKKGALRKQLGIPAEKKVPRTLVKKIVSSDLGKTIGNPTQIGKRRIVITKKLKKRAQFVKSFE